MWWLGKDWFECREYGGQEVTVMPKHNMVYVIQATSTPSCKTYGDVFEIVIEHLNITY